MKKNVAIKLEEKIQQVMKSFSRKDRKNNFNGEEFVYLEKKILSENTVFVIAEKLPTKKLCGFFFYYLPNYYGGKWRYFVPNDSHILGFGNFYEQYRCMEDYNYRKNFTPASEFEVEK